MKDIKEKLLYFSGLVLLALLVSIPVILPYFNAGFFPTHDGEWAVVRLVDMFRILRDGQFPARMSGALNFGYGYPLFNFAYPFPYYLGIPIYFVLGSFVASVKTIFAASVIFSGIFMFLASNALWKNKWAAAISTMLYVYLPYRMVDLYVRGSIGESLAFALFPLIFYLMLKLFDAPLTRFTILLLSLSVSVLILTHNIMAILFLPVLIIFLSARVICEKRRDVLKAFLLCMLLGVGLAAFFWVPALFEKSNILLSKTPIADRNLYFVNLNQLIIPSWGYASPTGSDGFSYQLGTAQVIVLIASLLLIVYSFTRNRFFQTSAHKYVVILEVIYFLAFLMLFSFTSSIWKILPFYKEINYPWTVLSQLGFITSLLAGFIAVGGKVLRYAMVIVSVIAVILSLQYAKPSEYVNRGEDFYMTNEATTTSSKELMPLWVKEVPETHYKEKVEIIKGSAEIKNLIFNSKKLSFDYISHDDAVFRINTIYYPGWNLKVNGKKSEIIYSNKNGLMEVGIREGKGNITFSFNETPLRFSADILSMLSFLMLIIFVVYKRPFKI